MDYLGNQVEVGDIVVHASGVSCGFSKMIVHKVTTKSVGSKLGNQTRLSYFPLTNVISLTALLER